MSKKVRITQVPIEVMFPRPTYSPTTVTGAGITQAPLEVMILDTQNIVRISQCVLEVMILPEDGNVPPSSGSKLSVWGHAG